MPQSHETKPLRSVHGPVLSKSPHPATPPTPTHAYAYTYTYPHISSPPFPPRQTDPDFIKFPSERRDVDTMLMWVRTLTGYQQ